MLIWVWRGQISASELVGKICLGVVYVFACFGYRKQSCILPLEVVKNLAIQILQYVPNGECSWEIHSYSLASIALL